MVDTPPAHVLDDAMCPEVVSAGTTAMCQGPLISLSTGLPTLSRSRLSLTLTLTLTVLLCLPRTRSSPQHTRPRTQTKPSRRRRRRLLGRTLALHLPHPLLDLCAYRSVVVDEHRLRLRYRRELRRIREGLCCGCRDVLGRELFCGVALEFGG